MRAWLALAAAAVGGVVVWWWRRSGAAAAGEVERVTRVRHRERAAGVDARLVALLDAWEVSGSHVVEVARDGGLRVGAAAASAQALAFREGRSNARTLAETPHGAGKALDVWPEGFAAHVAGSWAAVPAELRERFAEFGRFAEARGFVWGGRWRSATFPNGDQPHVEVKDWRRTA